MWGLRKLVVLSVFRRSAYVSFLFEESVTGLCMVVGR